MFWCLVSQYFFTRCLYFVHGTTILHTKTIYDINVPLKRCRWKPRVLRSWGADKRACVNLPECPSLPSAIAHGFVNGSGSLEGAGYEFSCERGYALIGFSRIVCTDAGIWSGSLPTCLIGKKIFFCQPQRINENITFMGRAKSKMLRRISSQPLETDVFEFKAVILNP